MQLIASNWNNNFKHIHLTSLIILLHFHYLVQSLCDTTLLLCYNPVSFPPHFNSSTTFKLLNECFSFHNPLFNITHRRKNTSKKATRPLICKCWIAFNFFLCIFIVLISSFFIPFISFI